MNHDKRRARRNPKTMSLSTYMTRMGNKAERTKPKDRPHEEDLDGGSGALSEGGVRSPDGVVLP